jgi:hypothetical protein
MEQGREQTMDREGSSSRAHGHLRQLVRMRWLAIGIAATLVYSMHGALDIDVPLAPLLATLGAYVLVNAASSLLYFTGGGVNPFAACYLLLVLYASVTLPQRLAWTVAVVCVLSERRRLYLARVKESGRGSGAGVLTACAAVERFGGTIQISERRGGGTRVQIELPLFRPRTATTGEDDEYGKLGIA